MRSRVTFLPSNHLLNRTFFLTIRLHLPRAIVITECYWNSVSHRLSIQLLWVHQYVCFVKPLIRLFFLTHPVNHFCLYRSISRRVKKFLSWNCFILVFISCSAHIAPVAAKFETSSTDTILFAIGRKRTQYSWKKLREPTTSTEIKILKVSAIRKDFIPVLISTINQKPEEKNRKFIPLGTFQAFEFMSFMKSVCYCDRDCC